MSTLHRRRLTITALVLLVSSCGGGGDDAATDGAATDGAASDAPAADAATATDPAAAAVSSEVSPTIAAVNILTDFGDACRGVSLPGATSFDPARGGIHPVIAVTGEAPDFSGSLIDLPDTWDPVVGQEQTVELIACLARTSSTLRQTCDGYLDDNEVDTGNTVEMYDATYDVSLVAATTAEVVATAQLTAEDDQCPIFVLFDEGQSVKQWYAEPDESLVTFLAEFAEG